MFEKYIVGKDGTIISKYSGKAMSPHADRKGYCRVRLHTDTGVSTFLVHRVVALVHLPNPLGLPQINHLDGDKSNNSLSNLEWTTGKDNVKHSVDTGLVKRGIERPNAKLTDEQVLEMRRLREEGHTYYVLGDMFNISYQTAHKICSRMTYTHI